MLQLAKNYLYLQTVIALGWGLFALCINGACRRQIKHKPFIALSLINTIFFFSPNLIVVHALVFLLPFVFARSRDDLLILLVAGMLGIPAISVELAAGSLDLFGWTLQATMALGGALALLALPVGGGRGRPVVNVSLALFMALCIVIAIRGTTPSNWLRQGAAVVFAYGLPVLVIGACARTSGGRRTLMTAIAAMGAIVAALLTYETWAHWPLYVSVYDRLHVNLPALVVKVRNGAMRAYGPLDDATGAGFALVITLLAALAGEGIFKRGVARFGVPLLILVGLLAPQSRGGLIGAGVGILAFAWYRYGAGGFGKALVLLSTVGIALAVRSQWAIGNLGDAEGTGDYRKRLFTRGMEEFHKHPLFGDTFQNVLLHMVDMKQGEGIVDIVNSYLYYALFTGVLGLAIFCIILFYPVGHLVVVRRALKRDSAATNFAAFAFSSLLAASIMLAFTSIPQRPIIILLVLAGVALTLRRAEGWASGPRPRVFAGSVEDATSKTLSAEAQA